MKKHINSFEKGLNRDYSKNKFPNNAYYNAEGLRLITKDGLSTFALSNIEGNTSQGSLHTGWTIHGQQAWCVLREKLIILAIGSTPGTNDRIYQYTINGDGTLTPIPTAHGLPEGVIYQGDLDFQLAAPIKKIIPRYESDTIQKIYWTQGTTGIKLCNIVDPVLYTYTAAQFDSTPPFNIVNISIDSIGKGNLNTGMVQYTYRQYNLNGNESLFVTPGQMVPLSGSESSGTDMYFTGSASGTNAGKSITISLTGLDTTFNRVEVLRIHHTGLLDEPVITIIANSPISSVVTITDDGVSNLGTYTLEEFVMLNYDFTCQDLETKNNFLFAANISENKWDVDYDARAYRFNSTGIATISNEDGTTPIVFSLIQLQGGSVVIPETHDCYNSYNVLPTSSANWDLGCKYKGTAAIRGGEGLNVTYSFTTSDFVRSENDGWFLESNHIYNTNSIVISEETSHMRDEIYSYGVVLINTKGQSSYVKWIGDIRFPSIRDSDSYVTAVSYGLSDQTYVRNLNIKFTFTNLPTDCTAFQIVRCERTTDNRTILAQGLVSGTRSYSTFLCPTVALTTTREYDAAVQFRTDNSSGLMAWYTDIDKSLVTFYSPEISYGNNIEFHSGDKLEPNYYTWLRQRWVKVAGSLTTWSASNPIEQYDYNDPFLISPDFCGYTGSLYSPKTNTQSITVDDFKVAAFSNNPPTDDNIVPAMTTSLTGATSYENYIRKAGGANLQGVHGTCGLLKLNTSIVTNQLVYDPSPSYGRTFIMANYKRYFNPYGGASYAARQRREYIAVTDISLKASNVIYITRGDTFITDFTFQRAMASGLENTSQANVDEMYNQTIRFPVETSINCRWGTSKNFLQEYVAADGTTGNRNAISIQENAGVWQIADNVGMTTFTQTTPLYAYNSVYSKQNNTIKFLPELDDAATSSTFDTRVLYSKRKYNNELIDSWTQFDSKNVKDVDSQYGPINALINYNSDLIYFQDSGFGVLSVEERELVSGSNGTQLTLGVGGILSRYDYISTNGGCKHPNSIYRGRYSMYFYDNMNKSIFSFVKSGGGDNNLSKIMGIQSYLNTNITGTNLTDVITGYNPKYNEVMFTFSATSWTDTTYKTLVYSELSKEFSRIDKINPLVYINHTDYNYMSSTGADLYLSNAGNYGQFFGTYYPSKLSVLINPDGVLVNRFDIVQWITEFSNTNHKTFDTIKFYNDWQNTSVSATTLVEDSNMFYINRTWRFNQFFDSLEQRIKDSYMLLELEYTNASNDKLVVHDIITTYSPTAPW